MIAKARLFRSWGIPDGSRLAIHQTVSIKSIIARVSLFAWRARSILYIVYAISRPCICFYFMGSLRVSAFYLSILTNGSILSDFFYFFYFCRFCLVSVFMLTLVLCIFNIFRLKFSRPADHASTGLATTAYIDTIYQVEV